MVHPLSESNVVEQGVGQFPWLWILYDRDLGDVLNRFLGVLLVLPFSLGLLLYGCCVEFLKHLLIFVVHPFDDRWLLFVGDLQCFHHLSFCSLCSQQPHFLP